MITRYGNGKIDMIKLNQGDADYFENRGKNYINDLENIGEYAIVINILEYKTVEKKSNMHFSN